MIGAPVLRMTWKRNVEKEFARRDPDLILKAVHERVYLFDETPELVMWGSEQPAGPTAA